MAPNRNSHRQQISHQKSANDSDVDPVNNEQSIDLEDRFIQLAKMLAHNMKRHRDAAVRKIQSIMAANEEMSDFNLLKLWKGLFYCMWMSDKRHIQQELAQRIAEIVYVPSDPAQGVRFCWGFWRTMAREWHGIDHLRLDKFYYFCRQMLFHGYLLLRKHSWSPSLVEQYAQVMEQFALNGDMRVVPPSLCYHVCENTLESLELASAQEIEREKLPKSSGTMKLLLRPIIKILGYSGISKVVYTKLRENFFNQLGSSDEHEAISKAIASMMNERINDQSVDECNRQRMESLFRQLTGSSPVPMPKQNSQKLLGMKIKKRGSDPSASLPEKMRKRPRPQCVFTVTDIETNANVAQKIEAPEKKSEKIISWSVENSVKPFDKKKPAINIQSSPTLSTVMASPAPIKPLRKLKLAQNEDNGAMEVSDLFDQIIQSMEKENNMKQKAKKAKSKPKSKKQQSKFPDNVMKSRPCAADFM